MWFYLVFLMISALSGLLFPPERKKKIIRGPFWALERPRASQERFFSAQEPPKSDFWAQSDPPKAHFGPPWAHFGRKVTLQRPTWGPPGRILDAKMSSNRPLRPGGMRGAIKYILYIYIYIYIRYYILDIIYHILYPVITIYYIL